MSKTSKTKRKVGAASADATASHEVPGSDARKRRPHAIHFTEPSLTRQSFAAECDVNFIIDRFTKTGLLPPNRRGVEAQFGEAPDVNFFEAACIQAEMRSVAEDERLNPSPEAAQEPLEDDTAEIVPDDPEAEKAPQDAAQDESSGE